MSNICVLDIETLPTEDPEVIAEIASKITAPGNYKKEDSIKAWEAENKPALVQEAVAKTALDGTHGRILCIGSAIGEEAPTVLLYNEEKRTLEAFMSLLDSQHLDKDTVFVGHNIHSFDLRFIWQRCVINNVKMNPVLKAACQAKAWDKCIGDTMLLWNPDRDKRISLKRLCRALGIKRDESDIDGSQVYEMYKAGELEKIAAHCRNDVRDVRECYKRLTNV